VPIGVVLPRTIDDVIATVEVCRNLRLEGELDMMTVESLLIDWFSTPDGGGV
jgi:hypothetical protein